MAISTFCFFENDMMSKKQNLLQSKIDRFPYHKIYLNVNHLEKGEYILNIVYKNKVIKKTTFKK
jgi:hypothetical protein